MDVCALWYGRCYPADERSPSTEGRCWGCMSDKADACLDCTPGYSILTRDVLTRGGRDKHWALTRGDLSKQTLPKWCALCLLLGLYLYRSVCTHACVYSWHLSIYL